MPRGLQDHTYLDTNVQNVPNTLHLSIYLRTIRDTFLTPAGLHLLNREPLASGLVTGKEECSDPNSSHVKQLVNPSRSSMQLLTARGIARLLRRGVAEAKLYEEAISQGDAEDETVAAYTIVTSLTPLKRAKKTNDGGAFP